MKKLEKRNKLQSVTAYAVTIDCTQSCIKAAANRYGGTIAFPCGRDDSQYVQIVNQFRNTMSASINNF